MTIKLSKSLTLPDTVATLTTAVLGIRGSGKTSTAVCISEDLIAAGHQVVVIDPLDVWWGLRSSADGKKPGCPVAVLGGLHADVPITEADAKSVADVITETRQSAIISMRHLNKSSQRRFMADFAERVYFRKGEAGRNTPCLFVVDEASSFVPQRFDSSEARMVGAIEDWVRRGRASGIGVMLIDQRPASVNKDVLTQIEMLICHRTNSPQDRKALKLWIDAHDTADSGDTFLGSLASLKTGEAWLWSPSWLDLFERVQVRKRVTFDSSATPTGGAVAAPKGQAAIDVNAFKGALVQTIEKAKADDPKELRRQIAELQKQLAQRPAVQPERVEVPVLGTPQMEKLESMHQRATEALEISGGELAHIRSILAKSAPPVNQKASLVNRNGRSVHNSGGELHNQIVDSHNQTGKVYNPPPRTQHTSRVSVKQSGQTRTNSTTANGDNNLTKAERSILTALYWLRSETITPSKVGFYADYTAGSGSFNNALGRLRSTGLVRGWEITADGIDVALSLGAGDKPAGGELREWLRRKLTKAENAILNALCEAYPNRLPDSELGSASGYTAGSGSFNNALGRLRSIEAAEGYARDGGAKAADVFFE